MCQAGCSRQQNAVVSQYSNFRGGNTPCPCITIASYTLATACCANTSSGSGFAYVKNICYMKFILQKVYVSSQYPNCTGSFVSSYSYTCIFYASNTSGEASRTDAIYGNQCAHSKNTYTECDLHQLDVYSQHLSCTNMFVSSYFCPFKIDVGDTLAAAVILPCYKPNFGVISVEDAFRLKLIPNKQVDINSLNLIFVNERLLVSLYRGLLEWNCVAVAGYPSTLSCYDPTIKLLLIMKLSKNFADDATSALFSVLLLPFSPQYMPNVFLCFPFVPRPVNI